MFILTETETKSPEYAYKESFATHKEARDKMMQLYKDVANDNNLDSIIEASYTANSAIIKLEDGNDIALDIKQIIVPTKMYLNPIIIDDMGFESDEPMYIQNQKDTDKNVCTVEYIRKDAFIESIYSYLKGKLANFKSIGDLEEFRHYISNI